MEYLNLPKIRIKPHKEKSLNMDDYLKFVINNLKYTINIKLIRKSKKNLFVNLPFVLE